MPFSARTVEPQLVSRLRGSDGSEKSFITPDGRRVRKPVLFSSLEEVCCHTLTGILHQLSDLSRHASDIFLGIETQAVLVTQRTSSIQVRLERLQLTVRKSDPKTVKIREENAVSLKGRSSVKRDRSALTYHLRPPTPVQQQTPSRTPHQ
ncbi:hypothetical protein QQF64_016008 [Cirrhinus molitorella]|uniref:Uncharacterized protein n=1 Tax=Cirrhinus molitorella TaxID=172907 RepID=A0ABR3LPW4_9TELE